MHKLGRDWLVVVLWKAALKIVVDKQIFSVYSIRDYNLELWNHNKSETTIGGQSAPSYFALTDSPCLLSDGTGFKKQIPVL